MSQVKQEPATATATATTRTSRNICDGCAFRRVKCDGLDPCAECESRSVRCSHLRVRRKRGPKGPRASTAQKIQAVQGRLLQANGVATMRDGSSVAHPYEHDSIIETVKPHTPSGGVARYGDYIRIFKARLYLTWPVVDPDALLARLEKGDEHDWGSYALAASLSAAVIAQLRLSDIADRRPDRHALTFAQQARRLQSELDFQDRCELDSLLVSFFLHMYFANVQKEATATLMLRDAISRAHVLGLHRPRSWQKDLFADESQRLLLIYWILFVTERTFCAENDLTPILRPIDVFPTPHHADSQITHILPAFLHLARLFVCLESQFCITTSEPELGTSDASDTRRIASLQSQLRDDDDDTDSVCTESQKLDIVVTRHWIRTLIWRHSITHCRQLGDSSEEDPSCTIFYPVVIAKELLSMLSAVSVDALCTHGYGMELKISRVANSLVNVLVCVPHARPSLLTMGWQDVLHAMDNVLQTIGGQKSPFSTTLRQRMLELDLPLRMNREIPNVLPVDAVSYYNPSEGSDEIEELGDPNLTRSLGEALCADANGVPPVTVAIVRCS